MGLCHECGYENLEGVDFCESCGAYLGWESTGTAGPRIFLNYRREDTAGRAGRLCHFLAEGIEGHSGFGQDQILMDIEAIEHGDDFGETIRAAVEGSDVFLAVIGEHWLTATDSKGRRRLDDPADFVRVEIEAALERAAKHHDVRVIPVLVEGAEMPSVEELPDGLAGLAHRNAIRLRDERWHYDVGRLLASLKKLEHPLEHAERPLPRERPSSAPEPSQHEVVASPGWMADEASLRFALRQAALAGVVPALVPAATIAERSPSVSEAPSSAPLPAPPARTAGSEASARRPLAIQLLRMGVPLALLLGGVAAAFKWLLGLVVEPVELPTDMVECTVFAPPSAAPGSSILVQAFVHLPEQADDARAIALELDTEAHRRTFRSLDSRVTHFSRLDFELRMPGLEVDDPLASLVWRGRPEAVQFGVGIPQDAPQGTVIGTLEISVNRAPVGHVKFKLGLDPSAGVTPSEPQGDRAHHYTAAFISYASKDRDKVLARVQMLSAVGIRYFQDVLSLEPGDRWSKKLELGIEDCDLFLLFWSNEAKQSEWVRKEVQYALARRGEDDLSPPEIRPVILEFVEPWEELAHLHFNDRLLYFMRPLEAG
jgi:hypothetical protein